MNVIEGVSPASPVQSVIPKRFKRDTCETFTQPKRLNFLPTAPVTTTPLDDFLTSQDTSALKQELNTHKNQYDNLVESTEESHLLITVDRRAASVITVLKVRTIDVEKTIEGIRERLLSEVPERYHCIRGGNINYTLLNLDVNINCTILQEITNNFSQCDQGFTFYFE